MEERVERASNHSAAQSSPSEANGKPWSEEKRPCSGYLTMLSPGQSSPGRGEPQSKYGSRVKVPGARGFHLCCLQRHVSPYHTGTPGGQESSFRHSQIQISVRTSLDFPLPSSPSSCSLSLIHTHTHTHSHTHTHLSSPTSSFLSIGFTTFYFFWAQPTPNQRWLSTSGLDYS